ncbi:hypothetical protein B0H19DRAFT_449374 [Mycena capillaripes]|nr:hypothetical protein B0H19DRAFT_449374 [Mycena capillaripes]
MYRLMARSKPCNELHCGDRRPLWPTTESTTLLLHFRRAAHGLDNGRRSTHQSLYRRWTNFGPTTSSGFLSLPCTSQDRHCIPFPE